MNLNEPFEESVLDQIELRGTRIAPATTLVIGTALLTQLMVLSGVAIIMGVAVFTMCALALELLVLTVVAAVVERGVVDTEDLWSIMEIAATLLVTIATIVIASTRDTQSSEKTSLFDGYPIAALKLS